jgi:hypothetical protein
MSSFDLSNTSEVSREISTTVYSRRALTETTTAYRDHLKVSTRTVGKDRLRVSVAARNHLNRGQLQSVALEFWNHYLAKTCEDKVG